MSTQTASDYQTYGNWLSRRLNFVWQVVRRPHHFLRWSKARTVTSSALDQGIPWLSWPAIDYLQRSLRPGMEVFEWGGGGSTLFFVRQGCSVTTVEDNADWKQAIERRLAGSLEAGRQRLTVQLVPVSKDDRASLERYIAPVRADQWDVVLVDGADAVQRSDCVKAACDHVRPGGLLVLDDAYRPDYAEVPAILQQWRRLPFWGLGPGRRGVTKTDVYVCPED